ncbi:hypothetical protein NF867_07765 [Solitalea sp. MAHUQ-68]|uniref:Uncharacterized protein n=1 Tax=Solitalea agri TaxID=2953739 RepID=A0A9X2F131_9SPHI|nr:hypothetical protein [Solitalea agri]MCO4292754.1 hypothetical protein [Solitalea agri]
MKASNKKYTDLIICLIMDFLGMSTYSIPILGELGDIVWAPFSAMVFFLLFRKKIGLIGGAFNFLEELLPATDIIPTFTIAWIGKYLIGNKHDDILVEQKEETKKLN